MDRPVTVDRRHQAPPVDRFASCPPWCQRDPDWHGDDGEAVHDGDFVVVAVHSQPCTRHDEGPAGDELWLALERTDEDDRAGPVHIYLGPTSGVAAVVQCQEVHLDLDEAETLIARLRDLLVQARGAKRARDIVVGDTIVLDGVEQVVCVVLQDAQCCCDSADDARHGPADDGCPGSYAFATSVCADGDWTTWGGAWAFAPDTLIPVPAGGAR